MTVDLAPTPAPPDTQTGPRILHWVCTDCDPDHALCGKPLDGAQLVTHQPPGTIRCVVCDDLDRTHDNTCGGAAA